MLAACEARDEGWYVAELLRIKAELLLSRDGELVEENAAMLLQRSLDLAHAQGALAWKLRAATSLARLWIQRGREVEAGALLRPVHGQFTEGSGTEDLCAAAALLRALS
jgi:predicted ATPase